MSCLVDFFDSRRGKGFSFIDAIVLLMEWLLGMIILFQEQVSSNKNNRKLFLGWICGLNMSVPMMQTSIYKKTIFIR